MSDLTIEDISEELRDIDIAFLSTRTEGGAIATRPMSNNREVDYDGDSYYFTMDDTRTVADIGREPKVSLGFTGEGGFYIAVSGRAEIVRDREQFEERWSPDLDEWFPEGIDTPGIVMVKVSAERIHYWDGEEEGEVPLDAGSA